MTIYRNEKDTKGCLRKKSDEGVSESNVTNHKLQTRTTHYIEDNCSSEKKNLGERGNLETDCD